MRTWTVVAALILSSTAVAWQSVPMAAEDGTIRLSGFEADGYTLLHDRRAGSDHYTEYRW